MRQMPLTITQSKQSFYLYLFPSRTNEKLNLAFNSATFTFLFFPLHNPVKHGGRRVPPRQSYTRLLRSLIVKQAVKPVNFCAPHACLVWSTEYCSQAPSVRHTVIRDMRPTHTPPEA